jgi:hypothetical protein
MAVLKNGTGNRTFSSVVFSLGLFGTRQRATYFFQKYVPTQIQSQRLSSLCRYLLYGQNAKKILNPSALTCIPSPLGDFISYFDISLSIPTDVLLTEELETLC